MSEDDWIDSTIPFGEGFVNTQLETIGTIDFTNIGLSMEFTQVGSANITVTQIDSSANIPPNGEDVVFDDQYWIVDRFGSGNFNSDLTFTISEDLTTEDENSPHKIILYSRNSNSDEDWFYRTSASSIDALNNTVTFTAIDHFSQFIIARSEKLFILHKKLADCEKVMWGDPDNDDDLDAFVCGEYTGIIENTSAFSNFLDFELEITDSDIAWGDFDNDNDLDILIAGKDENETPTTMIYQNNGNNNFANIGSGITGIFNGSVAWLDYNNDGFLDLFITGESTTGVISKLYQNDEETFTEVSTNIQGIKNSDLDVADFDGNGYMDIIICGKDSLDTPITKLFLNSDGIFTENVTNLSGVYDGSIEWGDYDSDGDLDLIISGIDAVGTVTEIFENNSGNYIENSSILPQVSLSDTKWGDFDCDGNLDLIISGMEDDSLLVAGIFTNDSGNFSNSNIDLTGLKNCSIDWGDYDNDDDLDLLISGIDSEDDKHSIIYNNNSTNKNTKPSAPTNLDEVFNNDNITFNWNSGYDLETGTNGLSYNIKIGNSESDSEFKSPMSDLTSGFHLFTGSGNVTNNNFWTFDVPDDWKPAYPQQIAESVSISWCIQALDNNFSASEFSVHSNFSLNFEPDYLQTDNNEEMNADDILFWEVSHQDQIEDYQIQIADEITFANPVIFETLDMSSRNINDQKELNTFSYKDKNITALKWYLRKSDKLENQSVFSLFSQENMSKIKKNEKNGRPIFFYGVALNELADFQNLLDDTTYYWRIKPNYTGIDSTVYTDPTPTFTFNRNNSTPNPPVNGFNPANGDAVSSLTPMINWNNANDPDQSDGAESLSYVIQVDSLNSFNTIFFSETTSPGITSTTVSPALSEGYRYFYRIKTIDDEGLESIWSSTQNFITIMPPENVRITQSGSDIMIEWDEIPISIRGIVYTVYSSDDPDAAFPEGWTIEATQLTSPNWTDENQVFSKKFYCITAGTSSRENISKK